MSDDPTLPPRTNAQKAEAAAKSVWAWSQAHTLVTACVLSFAAGFVTRWLL